MNSIVAFNNVNFRYEGEKNHAFKNVNFQLKEKEIVFLTGLSGSGKSTLLNLLNGIIPEVIEGEIQGGILINGKNNMRTHERGLFLGNVFQNSRGQFFTTDTTAEMVFAMENYGIEKPEMERRLKEMVGKYNIAHLMHKNPFRISSGQRQLLALLSVLIMNPQVVIFDEPSANLDYGNAMRLKKQIQKLKEEGKTVLIADHRCFYLKGIIDRVLLLKDKEIHCFSSEKDFMESDFAKRSFDLFNMECEGESQSFKKEVRRFDHKEPILEVKNLKYKDVLRDVSLSVKKGETVTVVGVNGAGKTTLASLISKVLEKDEGEIITDEKVLYIMQDADYQLFGASVIGELEITQRDRKVNEEALKTLNLFHLKNKHPHLISGGEKQRLQMAIAKVGSEGIVILDEPTSGLDKDSMERLIQVISSLKEKKGILVISHDYEFIRKCSDRVVYLKDGVSKDEFILDQEGVSKLNSIYKEMEKYYE